MLLWSAVVQTPMLSGDFEKFHICWIKINKQTKKQQQQAQHKKKTTWETKETLAFPFFSSMDKSETKFLLYPYLWNAAYL